MPRNSLPARARESAHLSLYSHIQNQIKMNRQEAISLINSNPVCYLATVEGAQPRTRPFLVWKTDDDGIHMDTAPYKDVYKQLQKNPIIELCFHRQGEKKVLRLAGAIEFIEDPEIRKEYFGDRPDNNTTVFFVMKNAEGLYWYRDESGKAHYERFDF
jgi:uncharacterized pyridoxamine 5'-phosphate oxidase family protein